MAIDTLKKGFLNLLAIVAIGSLQYSSLTQSFHQDRNASIQDEKLLAEKNVERLKVIEKMPDLGFSNMYANWSFIQFLQYFGDDEARQKTGYSDSPEYLSTAIHHDPYFRDFYIFLSGSTTIYAGKPEETVKVMSEGLAQIRQKRAPDSYYIWRYKGTDELLFLNDGKSAQKSFEMAAKWAYESSDEVADAVGKVSEQTAQFLADNPASKLAQINAWGGILTTALDNETRNRAIAKIRELGGDVVVGSDGQLQIKYAQVEKSAGEEKPNN